MIKYTITDTLRTHKGIITKTEETTEGKFVEIDLGHNDVLIGGLKYLCRNIYRVEPRFTLPFFENLLYATGEDDLAKITRVNTQTFETPYVQCYNLHLDGADGDGVLPYDKHMLGFDREFKNIIPFRVIPIAQDDPSKHMLKYMHRIVRTEAGERFAYYYSKRLTNILRSDALTEDGSTIPSDPDVNLTGTNLDTRVINQFSIILEDEELSEFFAIHKTGGKESTRYNGVSMLMGYEAKIALNGASYSTMIDSVSFTRANHVTVPKGVQGKIEVMYKIMHI